MTISIITPWLNNSQLVRTYEPSVKGAEVIIVDNGSEPAHAAMLAGMVRRLGGVLIRNEDNRGFAAANNQGLAQATGDIIVFLNNDIEAPAPAWLEQVERDVEVGVLAGPSLQYRHGIAYIEGYCIAGRREVWEQLGGWPADLPGMYWEDNILCLQAQRAGIRLKATNWPVWHFSNYTSRQTPGAYDHSAANERVFLEMLSCAS